MPLCHGDNLLGAKPHIEGDKGSHIRPLGHYRSPIPIFRAHRELAHTTHAQHRHRKPSLFHYGKSLWPCNLPLSNRGYSPPVFHRGHFDSLVYRTSIFAVRYFGASSFQIALSVHGAACHALLCRRKPIGHRPFCTHLRRIVPTHHGSACNHIGSLATDSHCYHRQFQPIGRSHRSHPHPARHLPAHTRCEQVYTLGCGEEKIGPCPTSI